MVRFKHVTKKRAFFVQDESMFQLAERRQQNSNKFVLIYSSTCPHVGRNISEKRPSDISRERYLVAKWGDLDNVWSTTALEHFMKITANLKVSKIVGIT